MGASAVFMSAFAFYKLPLPSNPPQTQQDILALAISPIVSFVVLSSIVIRASTSTFLSFCEAHTSYQMDYQHRFSVLAKVSPGPVLVLLLRPRIIGPEPLAIQIPLLLISIWVQWKYQKLLPMKLRFGLIVHGRYYTPAKKLDTTKFLIHHRSRTILFSKK